jgi:hypothetical protein
MVAVPGIMPVTTPAEVTVAIPAEPDDHVPPDGEPLNVVVPATQTARLPDILPLTALTVTTFVAEALPQLLVTV